MQGMVASPEHHGCVVLLHEIVRGMDRGHVGALLGEVLLHLWERYRQHAEVAWQACKAQACRDLGG